MKRGILFVALLAAAAMAAQPGWARSGHRHGRHAARGVCSRSAMEAEQAIRYVTDLMVASAACRDTTYAKFALRNRRTIIRYQRAMIAHLHGKAAFDRWNTVIANEAALREGALPPGQFCSQAQPLLRQASALDARGFRAYAAARAAHADPPGRRCRR